MLDEAGLRRLKIVASGGLNETRIEALVKAGAPIDIFGVGTEMSVAADARARDIACMLTEFAGSGRMKLSGRKATTPGRKQIFRQAIDRVAVRDVVARRDGLHEGTPLLERVMLSGKRVNERAALSALRDGCAAMIASLPPALRKLDKADKAYPVVASDRLRADAVVSPSALANLQRQPI